ncbi:hypothetical protein KKH27_14615 [bacterium]|nr:hypothetical protein [bacterium]MBU1984589.1 hypothetical protein [bacterium]
MKNLSLIVNGSEVSLNNFATRIIVNLLVSILESLTLSEKPREAVFRISE